MDKITLMRLGLAVKQFTKENNSLAFNQLVCDISNRDEKTILEFACLLDNKKFEALRNLSCFELLEKSLLKKASMETIYNYACNCKSANINNCSDTVCKSKNPYYNYKFAKFVKGASCEKHIEAIKHSFLATIYLPMLEKNISKQKIANHNQELELCA